MYSEEKGEHSVKMGQTPKVGANPDKGHTPGTDGYRGNEYNKIQDAIEKHDNVRISKMKKSYHK